MQRRLSLERALRLAFVAAQLGLIALLLATAAIYGTVYIARWLDDVAYHIPGTVRIAQHWNPYFVDSPVDSHWYPAGAETLAAVFVLATGSINSTNLSGAVSFLALCWLIYLFAGLWTRDLVARLASVLCVASVPLLLGQCLAFYVDIHFALLICASLYLQSVALVRGRARSAYGALTLAILAASVKYTGLMALAVLGPASLACLWLAPSPRRPRWAAALLLLVALAFTSGFYLRNWYYRANPLYPIPLPGWLQPIASLSPATYERDPDLLDGVPTFQHATPPHPWVPASWTAVKLKPDMTDDGFGAAGTLALLGTAVSLLCLGGLDARRRRAWLFVVGESAVLLLLFPLHATNPRFVLFLPVVASLSPAVLAAAVVGRRGRLGTGAFHVAILAASLSYAYFNLVAEGSEWTKVRQAAALLFPYRPNGARAVAYAQPGHLRIGYTSGFSNLIALLYDRDLSNELIPLHYRNYVLNHGHEFAAPEDFLAYVRSLDLDHIEIFDPRYPGADLLQEHFPGKVHVWDR